MKAWQLHEGAQNDARGVSVILGADEFPPTAQEHVHLFLNGRQENEVSSPKDYDGL
jgi:hypothetical protein